MKALEPGKTSFTEYTALVIPLAGDPVAFQFSCGVGTLEPGVRVLASTAWGFPSESWRAVGNDNLPLKALWLRYKHLIVCAMREMCGGQPAPGGKLARKKSNTAWVQVTTRDVPYSTAPQVQS